MTDQPNEFLILPHPDDVPLAGPDSPCADQIDDLIKILCTIRKRWGNTAVKYKIQWGSQALWAESGERRRIAKLEEENRALREALDSAWKVLRDVRGAHPPGVPPLPPPPPPKQPS